MIRWRAREPVRVRSRRTTPIVLVLGGVLTLASCTDDVFTRDDAVARMREAGVAASEAECIVDDVIERLDLDVLNEERDPTPNELRALDEIRAECAPEPD